MRKLKAARVLGILLGFFFIASCVIVISDSVWAGGPDKEITGNRGYLVGTPPEAEKEVIEKKPAIKREGVKPEFFEKKAIEIKEKTRISREADQATAESKGGIAPKGYLVGTPKEKPVAVEKERGKGGFAEGWNKAMDDLKEFNTKIRSKPYPSDQNLEGSKGGYIYGEPPLEKPEPERKLTRTQGLKPTEILPILGRGIENLHNTWSIKPHRSEDKEIWGFRFPDMPKKEKEGITRHRGDPVKTIQSFVEGVGADIEKHKAAAPVDK